MPLLTDDALCAHIGVRVAFSGREGGVSEGPFRSLNLGMNVGDDAARVQENRRRLLAAIGVPDAVLVTASQVHGDRLVCVDDARPPALEAACEEARAGADGLLVGAAGVAALLCFADCVPVVIVSPSGRFAVVHAGWRGVVASIAPKAVRRLAAADAAAGCVAGAGEFNVYIGPHIHAECFETGEDVHARFMERFGSDCATDARHVSLLQALHVDLAREGIDRGRIADAGVCTKCCPERYYSYRAGGGVCGRHGAIAIRKD